MKNKLLLLGLFVSSASIIFAQNSDYKLDSYINPTYKRKALDLGVNMSGSFQKIEESKNNLFGGDLDLRYNMVSNSQKEQATTRITLSGEYDSESRNKYSSKDAFTGLSFYREGLQFFKPKTFFEFTPSANVNYTFSEKEQNLISYYEYVGHADLDFYSKINNLSLDIDVKLGIGHGRIENVSDARQAMYILQDLQKKGLLKKTLTNDEVNTLTEQITLIKNKRQYDYRIALAEEITVVDSFLVANNYIAKDNSALYFTTLYDKWMYGDSQIREAGSYIKGGVKPSYSFGDIRTNSNYLYSDNYYNLNFKDKDINSNYGAALYVDYRYEKPINLSLQSSFNAGVSAGAYKYRYFDDTFYNAHLNLSYKLGYYLNTRTYISAEIYESIDWNKSYVYRTDVGDKRSNSLYSYSGISVNAYYYLSPQLRVFGNCNVNYYYRYQTNQRDTHDDYPSPSFNLGFSYAIF